MAENSKIEWTHAAFLIRHCVFLAAAFSFGDRFQMNLFVAILAKRKSIAEFIAKLWKVRERLDVVSIQIAAFVVAAMLASVGVSLIYGSSPLLIFNAATLVQIALFVAVLVGVVVSATRRSFAHDLANSRFRFSGMGFTSAVRPSLFCRYAHLQPSFHCVRSSLKSRRLAFHVLPDFYASAPVTLCVKPIVPSAIFAEVRLILPCLAFRATFQALADQPQEFFNGDSGLLC